MGRFIRLFDVLPGWLWACAVGLLVALCIRLDVQRAGARTEAAEARAALLSVQISSRDAILAELRKARLKEAPLMQVVQEANDAVQSARQNLAVTAADTDERLRKLSRSLRVCRSDAGGGASGPQVDAGGGAEGTGFRAMAGGDLLVLDGQARAESARLTAEANFVRDTLTECIAGWDAAHLATKREAVPMGP